MKGIAKTPKFKERTALSSKEDSFIISNFGFEFRNVVL